jgi:SAM-dependent methyltransferase
MPGQPPTVVEKDAVRRGYDALAETYAAERGTNARARSAIDRFRDALPEPKRVLDAGCGGGAFLGRLPPGGVGLDLSREQLRLAAWEVPDAALVQGDMASLPFAAAAFDGVLAYWSLIHVPLAEHPGVLEEFARVLRPGGRLLLSEGTDRWVGENPDWLGTGVGMSWEIAGQEATREYLRDAGFAIERVVRIPEALGEEDEEADGEPDGDGSDSDDDGDDLPWRVFDARLDA